MLALILLYLLSVDDDEDDDEDERDIEDDVYEDAEVERT